MAVYGYTKNYKLVKPQFDSDTWHDYEYDNLDTIDAVLSAIYASGDWQGFWKTNTNYKAGSVVIDRDTDTMYKVLQDHTTDGSTFNEYYTAHPDYYRLWSPNNLAEDWAVKMDGDVETGEYSAKAHASSEGLVPTGSAKEWAIGSGEVGSSGEYSAKKYATDAHNDYISMTTDANVSAVGSNINNVNAVGQSISNVNTVAGNISDVNTAALNIEAIKDAPNQAASANNSKIEAQNSANTAQTMATQAGQSATSAAQSAQTATNKADEASESAQLAVAALSLQIGDVCFAPLGIDESLNLRRYLNGQVIIQSQFVAFTNKVKSAIALYPNLATTETNWQAEKTNSKLGQCGKFVVDDTAGTIRLPCVVNAQGLVDLALIGGIKSESLPNITGTFGGSYYTGLGSATNDTGAFQNTLTISANRGGGNEHTSSTHSFDASGSSSTYQDNAPVQQEAVQYPYCIVVNTGVEETDRPINNYQVNNVYSYGMSQYYKGTMNNNSWLKSAGQWNDGTVYTGMYNWLLEQMNAGVSGFVASTAAYTDYDFVINTTDQTFRLPLKNGQEGVFADGVKGNGMTLGLTNGTQTLGIATVSGNNVGSYLSIYGTPVGTAIAGESLDNKSLGVTNDPSKSGIIVDKTVPSGWNLYYYVGDTLQNAQLVNVARIEETLVDKTNKVQAAEASMPSSRYIDLTLGASGSTYTAPANGWFTIDKHGVTGSLCALENLSAGKITWIAQLSAETDCRVSCPAKRGDSVILYYNADGQLFYFRFVYAEGEQNV